MCHVLRGPTAVFAKLPDSRERSNTMDLMQSIRAFAAVADAGSFMGAARNLRVGTPQISRAVAALETRVGVRLLNRTTRTVGLTIAGEKYLVHCKCILDRLSLADAEAAGLNANLSGTIRIGVDPVFDRHHLIALISSYQERYPEVSVQLAQMNCGADMLLANHDAALLCGSAPRGHRLASECLGTTSAVLCASPVYLASHGTPQAISDLNNHRCLQFCSANHSTGKWTFDGPEGQQVFRFTPAPLRTDLADVLWNTILAGVGIGPLPVSLATPALHSGALERVLPHHRLAAQNVYILYQDGKYVDPVTMTWVEFLRASLGDRLAADQASLAACNTAVGNLS